VSHLGAARTLLRVRGWAGVSLQSILTGTSPEPWAEGVREIAMHGVQAEAGGIGLAFSALVPPAFPGLRRLIYGTPSDRPEGT
jgi:hypothetical protein